ncbi:methyl-accepting chemotaxis protein [Clostridium omnivorum]|uniref:Chemotaxis protein n=1 Tax=Clostridium omnivorum TaxID=1604902 RepID=A0ABQ5N7Y9_9CLOT|nr:methyl-accepting chemotaxis protein [Clostridium sp. E14]GLC31295.1 chemotaxis protein [Clostridium sp. E14]
MDNILFVAVSQKMADLASQVTAEMGLEIPIVVSISSEIQAVVNKHPNIEVFISRGRSSKVLMELTNKPVVEITSSIHDILKPVQKLTSKGINKIAVIASSKLIGDRIEEYKLGETLILLRPFEPKEFENLAFEFFNSGVKGLVATTIDLEIAKKYGMEVEALDSEEASIKRAINEAIKIAKAQEVERSREKEKSEKIYNYSTDLYKAIEEAAAAVEELTASSEELAATSQKTANIANKAYDEVQNTSAILEIITDVAKRINLLGLNAAIEASRAGEYGRGFSVVASEVRKLASESKNSAQNIDNLLNKFRTSVESVLTNVQQSNVIAKEQSLSNQNIAQMLDSLREISSSLMSMAERKL